MEPGDGGLQGLKSQHPASCQGVFAGTCTACLPQDRAQMSFETLQLRQQRESNPRYAISCDRSRETSFQRAEQLGDTFLLAQTQCRAKEDGRKALTARRAPHTINTFYFFFPLKCSLPAFLSAEAFAGRSQHLSRINAENSVCALTWERLMASGISAYLHWSLLLPAPLLSAIGTKRRVNAQAMLPLRYYPLPTFNANGQFPALASTY